MPKQKINIFDFVKSQTVKYNRLLHLYLLGIPISEYERTVFSKIEEFFKDSKPSNDIISIADMEIYNYWKNNNNDILFFISGQTLCISVTSYKAKILKHLKTQEDDDLGFNYDFGNYIFDPSVPAKLVKRNVSIPKFSNTVFF